MTVANETRGEVDLVLDSTRFVLRPSHEAILEVEKLTGKSSIALLYAASDGDLTAGDATTITTVFIRAWGKASGNQIAQNVDAGRIGELIHEYGLMNVTLRLVTVLGMAVTGGCKADGTFKEGEVTPATRMTAILGAGSLASRQSRSGGAPKNSGGRRRTNSGGRSKSGTK